MAGAEARVLPSEEMHSIIEGHTMARDDAEDTTIYKVVINHEEQYSIWPADREPPLGWKEVGQQGRKAECLAYIKDVWTDMRPLSLRQKMAP
jgi:MbtH protein